MDTDNSVRIGEVEENIGGINDDRKKLNKI